MYLRIRCSPLGADFPADRFLRTPVRVIRWVLQELDNQEYGQANLNALPVARLTATLIGIAHGFSGSKRAAPKVEVKDFLPFPDWNPEGAKAAGPSEETVVLLKELLRKRRIPMPVFTALITPISQSA